MFFSKLEFLSNKEMDKEKVEDTIYLLVAALRMNGQVLGSELPVVLKDQTYSTYLFLPDANSLDKFNANQYVNKYFQECEGLGLSYSVEILGEEPQSAEICICEKHEWFILFSNFLSLESPLRCGNCFGVIPLYKIPYTSGDEYNDIISWQSDYNACDSLQMNCKTGERFGTQQLSSMNSSLSRQGIEICERITELSGVPAYYYLYRYTNRTPKTEKERKCPSCEGEWILDEPLHRIFDFKCDRCRLLSNISWSAC